MKNQVINTSIYLNTLFLYIFRFIWILFVLLLKLTFIAGVIILTFFAVWFAKGNTRGDEDSPQQDDDDHRFLLYDNDRKPSA
jgi:Ca2+/Na+ antiporter